MCWRSSEPTAWAFRFGHAARQIEVIVPSKSEVEKSTYWRYTSAADFNQIAAELVRDVISEESDRTGQKPVQARTGWTFVRPALWVLRHGHRHMPIVGNVGNARF
jgi:hypothetical protein